MEVEYTQYGKPYKNTLDFVEYRLKEIAENLNAEITRVYMIGDNPNSDIKGANSQGWISILVKTGVYQGQENDKENPA